MSRASKVFAVSADTAYEGSEVVAVFEREVDARAFADRCRTHDKAQPKPPSVIADTPENDALWDVWDKKRRRWTAMHPAKQISTHDWSVFLIPYHKAKT